MAFTPNAYTAVYSKNIPQQDSGKNIVFSYSSLPFPARSAKLINIPNWLTVLNTSLDATNKTFSFRVKINESVAYNMAEGQYSQDLKIKIDIGVSSITFNDVFKTYLKVEEGTLFNVTPNVLPFEWVIGDPLPQNKTIQLATDYNWTLQSTHSWLSMSPSSGLGSSTISVSVDPSGLNAGDYTAKLVARDGVSPEQVVDVSLLVRGQDNDVDFLHVSPQNLEFLAEFEEPNLTTKQITIESSGNWTATKSNYWLNLSQSSGTSGNSVITISVDSEALSVGSFTAPITFQMDDIIKTVYVQINIVSYFSEGIESENLYFAKDRNTLKVSSTEANTYLLADITTSTLLEILTYPLEAPYFKGLACLIIGLETQKLLKSVVPNSNFNSRIQNNISPINIGVKTSKINKITESISPIKNYSNLWFLKGNTPIVADKLCYIPSQITVTNKAVLSLSLLSTSSPEEIVISGDANAVISSSISDTLFVYNAIINIADFNLVPGNNITITFGSITTNVTIKRNEAEERLIAFENEWGEYEYFNTTGELTKTPIVKKKTTVLAVNGKQHTKTVSIDSGQEYVLNTGNLYSQEEVDWLSRILDSDHVFFFEDGDFTEVELTTNKLQIYKTRERLKNYVLKFKKAII